MNKNTKRRLLHFYTGGAIAEDFAASKRRKTTKFRGMIRVCFYIHCFAAAVSAGAGFLLGAELTAAIIIAVLAGISFVMGFFFAGAELALKIFVCVFDLVFGGLGIAFAAIRGGAFYVLCAVFMLVAFAADMVSLTAWRYKAFLMSYSARLIKRGDYTVLRNLALDEEDKPRAPTIESFRGDEEETPVLPPLTSEMRELARKMSDALRGTRL